MIDENKAVTILLVALNIHELSPCRLLAVPYFSVPLISDDLRTLCSRLPHNK